MAYKGKFKPKNTKKYEGDPTTIINKNREEEAATSSPPKQDN